MIESLFRQEKVNISSYKGLCTWVKNNYLYICIYVYIYVCVCVCIYIYIYRLPQGKRYNNFISSICAILSPLCIS